MKPAAVLIHVPDVDSALNWYQLAFEELILDSHESGQLALLHVNDFSVEIVKADDKVATGKCGSVLYWSISNYDSTITKLIGIGAKLHRGPMAIENGTTMCQIEDPFGNLIGLLGESNDS